MSTRAGTTTLNAIRMDLVFEIEMLHEAEARIATRATGRAGMPRGGDAETYLGAMDMLARTRRLLADYSESLR